MPHRSEGSGILTSRKGTLILSLLTVPLQCPSSLIPAIQPQALALCILSQHLSHAWTDTAMNRQLFAFNPNITSPHSSLVPATSPGPGLGQRADPQRIHVDNACHLQGAQRRCQQLGRGNRVKPGGKGAGACHVSQEKWYLPPPSPRAAAAQRGGDGTCGRNHSQGIFANNAGPGGPCKHVISSLKRQIHVTNKILEVN